MQLLTDWIVNIIAFILLAMIVDMLLPDTPVKKYVKLVTGILLITIVVTPIFKLLSTDVDEIIDSFAVEQSIQGTPLQKATEEKKREIETSQHAYILEQMAVQLKDKAEEEMIESYGMTIKNIQISSKPASEDILEDIQKITVYIGPKTEEKSVAAVEQVSIQIQDEGEKDQAGNDRIKFMLAKQWDVPESKIEIVDEGRNR